MIGSKLLHYEVTAKLGEGGMGEVYKATDSRLGREVAIKVLPSAFVEDPERLARFEREARVLAALEHPNIAGIYGLEEADGKQLLIMQLAHGQDLASRLALGPIPVEDALAIAAQIAHALEAAHDRGIVHRDLKPANVMLAPDGAVKVLDFGLAKSWDEGSGADPALTASPTLTAQMTQAGVILGTAGYMSPEQARGQEADRRSDIWSFGVVLHEMLTGDRVFQADTVSDTLARVLMAEPEWDEVDSKIAAPIAELLHRCLERDITRRLQAIGEARITIEDYLADPSSPGPGVVEPTDRGAASTSGPARWLLPALLLVGGILGGWLLARVFSSSSPSEAEHRVQRSAVRVPADGSFVSEDVHSFTISRDGGSIALVANFPQDSTARIYLKTETDAEPRVIPSTEGARNPFFSPDAESIGYFSDSGLYLISLAGGSPRLLATTGDRRGAVWHPNGQIYFVPHSDGPIMQVSDRGGEITQLTELDKSRNERTHRWPALLPGDRGLIYTSDTIETTEYYDDARIEWIDLETHQTKVLLEGSSRAVYSPTGHLVFARDGSLYAVDFDLDTIEVSGTPRLVVQNVSTTVASGAAHFALAENGTLAFIPGGKTAEVFDLVWFREGIADPEILVPEFGQLVQMAVSPDQSRVAVVDASEAMTDIWVYDLERGTRNRLTFGRGAFDPVWSHDGERVFFQSDTDIGVFSKRADGREEAQAVWQPGGVVLPAAVSPDGRFLLAGRMPEESPMRDGIPMWAFDLEGEREPFQLFEELVAGNYVDISPDGKWITYSSRITGQSIVYVKPFPEGPGKWQVSTGTASREPRWSADGRRIVYRTSQGYKYVEVDLTDGFHVTAPRSLSTGNMMNPFNHTYCPSADGKAVLMLRPTVTEMELAIHVVQNWRAELETLMRPAP